MNQRENFERMRERKRRVSSVNVERLLPMNRSRGLNLFAASNVIWVKFGTKN